MLLLCWKQSGGREAKLIALFTFRDTSFSSNGPIRCESIWDHFFCMRRSFLFCLTHANTHAHLSLLPLSSNDTFPKFGVFFFFSCSLWTPPLLTWRRWALWLLPPPHSRWGQSWLCSARWCLQTTHAVRGFFFFLPLFHIPDFQIFCFWSKDIKLNTNTLGHLFVEAFLGAYLCFLAHHPARHPHPRTGLVIGQWW